MGKFSMVDVVKGTLRAIKDLVAFPNENHLPRLSAGAITKLSWAKLIETRDQIPTRFQDFLNSLPVNPTEFPYVVLTPSYEGFINPGREKLVCLSGNNLTIYQRAGRNLLKTNYQIDAISFIEIGKILLEEWIKITGLSDNGKLTSSVIRFNSVTEELFSPILNVIRPVECRLPGTDPIPEALSAGTQSSLNFKFMNYAHRSIRKGERTIRAIWQPEIPSNGPTIFGWKFFRPVCLSHLVILTDNELILIREDEHTYGRKEMRYGGIWSYVPLDKITSVSITEKGNDLLVVSIHLPENDSLFCVFSVSQMQTIKEFIAQFELIKAGPKLK